MIMFTGKGDANTMDPTQLVSRRSLTTATAALLVSGSLRQALAQTRRRATPPQTEGPYYPVAEPRDADHDLLRNGALTYAKGQPAWVEGVVTDLDGKPLKGGVVEIWQCDEAGHYDHPRDGARVDPSFQGFGRVLLNAAGEFRFRTIKPVPYVGRTPHIHAKIKLGNRELLTTQLYVDGEPGNARDMIWRSLASDDRAAVTAPFTPVTDGLRARYALAVDA
jgi:protocatechuate 3,4-dioxygenase beta subunit